MKDRRLLFVHRRYDRAGGAEHAAAAAGEGLAARGWRCALLHGGEGGEPVGVDGPWTRAWDWSRGDLRDALAWKPDAVYLHQCLDLEVLRALADVPVLHCVHDHEWYCQRGSRYFPWNRRICSRRAGWSCVFPCGVLPARGRTPPVKPGWPAAAVERIALGRRFAAHQVASAFMRDELVRHGYDRTRIRVLPPIPSLPAPSPPTEREGDLVVFAGQLLRGKGLDVLLRALARIRRPWRLAVCGAGPELGPCRELARELGIAARVEFHGRVERGDVAAIASRAICTVVPSLWPEPFGLVGIESAAAGTAVVASAVGGIDEWCRHRGNGLLVRPGDPVALAEAIGRLLADPAYAEALGSEGRRLAAAFPSGGRVAEELDVWLAALLRGWSASSPRLSW